MRHQISGRKLNRTKSHRDAMFCNMATSLFEHKKVHTTEAKAKELRPFAEGLITKAKNALAREKQHLLPEGQTVDIHNRRLVGRFIRNKGVLQELFFFFSPAVEARNGGYTRIIKTGLRRGDASRTAIIELVDWSAPQDGTVTLKPKKKKKSKKSKTALTDSTVTTVTPKTKKAATTKAQVADVEESEEKLQKSTDVVVDAEEATTVVNNELVAKTEDNIDSSENATISDAEENNNSTVESEENDDDISKNTTESN
jgi:large subunit ribosomal protein L17